MQGTELFVRRPVFTTVMTLVIAVIGFLCYQKLPVRKLPKVDVPMISVRTEYHGASPLEVEMQVTRLLEGAFGTIPGAQTISSQSRDGLSEILITFAADRDSDAAAADVRDRLSNVKSRLPRGIPETTVRKAAADHDRCIVLAFTAKDNGNNHPVEEIYDYVDHVVKPHFENIDGVGSVKVYGSTRGSMRVYVDPHRLAAYGYTTDDIVEAIHMQHYNSPAGKLVSDDQEYVLMAKGELTKAEEFDKIVLPNRYGFRDKMVRLQDIGKAYFIASNTDMLSASFFNGQPSVSMVISKQSIANPIDLSKSVQKVLPDLVNHMPAWIEMSIAGDEADEIKASINNVYRSVIEAIVLVILTVFLFLFSFSATFIPLVTIPVSLLGTFIALRVCDFSINIYTLLAMVLAVGLVVDDAIVVLENAHKYIEKGYSKVEAAIKGSSEIMFSVIAMTLTLAAAYIPIGLMPGTTGKYFREFALTLAGSVLISGFVALTLSPMMCSLMMSEQHGKESSLKKWHRNLLEKIEAGYKRILARIVHSYAFILSLFVMLVCSCAVLFYFIPSENSPKEDTGVLSLYANVPIGVSAKYILDSAEEMGEIIRSTPYMKHWSLDIDLGSISGYIQLVDWKKRDMTSEEIAKTLNAKLHHLPGVSVSASAGSNHSAGDSVEFVIQSRGEYQELAKKCQDLVRKVFFQHIESVGRWYFPNLNPQQGYDIIVDRDRASSLGVNVYDIVSTIGACVQGKKAGEFSRGDVRDEIFVHMDVGLRRGLEDLMHIPVRSRIQKDAASGYDMVPLADLVRIESKLNPTSIHRHNQMASLSFSGVVKPGYKLGDAIANVQNMRDKHLPREFHLSFTGESRTFIEEGREIVIVFLLALLFVYLIMAAQFESFVDPLIIMFTVPLSMVGALLLLFLLKNGSLNVYSKIGLVTLVGLITKHGILIVDFANRKMQEGLDAGEAVVEAAFMRLRPILMTTFAMVIGSVPLALASGAGAAARQQIGCTIVGGLVVGTVFTLLIIPSMYVIFANITQKGIVRNARLRLSRGFRRNNTNSIAANIEE